MTKSKLRIYAHRGARHEVKENSKEAFECAIDLGVDGIEADVQKTKDGQLILRHDDFLFHNGHCVYINQLSLEELIEVLDSAPLLFEEFLDLIPNSISVLLDLKTQNIALELCRIIIDSNKLKQFEISSFRHCEVLEIAQKYPQITTSIILASMPIHPAACLQAARTKGVSLNRTAITKDGIDELRAFGANIKVYTVNDLEELKKFDDLGVNAVITDNPRLLLKK